MRLPSILVATAATLAFAAPAMAVTVELLAGTEESDTLTSPSTISHRIEARGGNDVLTYQKGDTALGGGGLDVLVNQARYYLQGEAPSDRTNAGPDDDVVFTGYSEATAPSPLTCGTGEDVVFVEWRSNFTGDGCEYVITNFNRGGDQTPWVVAPGNVVRGTNANNAIYGTPGNEVILGGAGDDRLFDGANATNAPIGSSTASEDFIFGGSGDDTIDTGASNGSATWGTAKAMVAGGPGNDVIIFRGQRSLDCGAGYDFVYYGSVAPHPDRTRNCEELIQI